MGANSQREDPVWGGCVSCTVQGPGTLPERAHKQEVPVIRKLHVPGWYSLERKPCNIGPQINKAAVGAAGEIHRRSVWSGRQNGQCRLTWFRRYVNNG